MEVEAVRPLCSNYSYPKSYADQILLYILNDMRLIHPLDRPACYFQVKSSCLIPSPSQAQVQPGVSRRQESVSQGSQGQYPSFSCHSAQTRSPSHDLQHLTHVYFGTCSGSCHCPAGPTFAPAWPTHKGLEEKFHEDRG